MMCQQIDWTRQVGSAFSSDQKSVLDAVQRLRAQAAEVGNLKSTPEQTVETKTENEKVIVEVKPADPKVVYVPNYNPQAVYTTPPATTTTTTTTESTVSTGTAVAGGLFAFGAGVLIGNAMDDDDYCYPHWGTARCMSVRDRSIRRPTSTGLCTVPHFIPPMVMRRRRVIATTTTTST